MTDYGSSRFRLDVDSLEIKLNQTQSERMHIYIYIYIYMNCICQGMLCVRLGGAVPGARKRARTDWKKSLEIIPIRLDAGSVILHNLCRYVFYITD